jgi:hypothetical protein
VALPIDPASERIAILDAMDLVPIEGGYLIPNWDGAVRVGEKVIVASPIEAHFPASGHHPSLYMRIEMVDGVPLCTEITLKMAEGGEPLRQKHLRAMKVELFVEYAALRCSATVVFQRESGGMAIARPSPEAKRAVRTFKRSMTSALKQQVAQVYGEAEVGGIDAVMDAFGVSRTSAVRYINAARDAGLIEPRKR